MLHTDKCLLNTRESAPGHCQVRVTALIVSSPSDNIVHDVLIWKVSDFCHVDKMIATVAGAFDHSRKCLFRLCWG